MKFYSTTKKSPPVTARTAVLKGLAEDGGLFMPEQIPRLPEGDLRNLSSLSLSAIGTRVARLFFDAELSDSEIESIVTSAISFDAPLVPVGSNRFALELFHGPTLAFKDFGARFMAQLMARFAVGLDRELTILVATSGDTGSAVANAFHGVQGTRVVLLYPSGMVSNIQESQLTTFGGNVHAIEILGTFDECQQLVKQAFRDPELTTALQLASANSINIARLIPQMFYYLYAVGQLATYAPVLISVPSGNFGNLTAGLMAKKLGLDNVRFVAATNSNSVVPDYLTSGNFTPRPSKSTISNAMDVGNPSNFPRMLELYGNNLESLRGDVKSRAFSDDQTRNAMKRTYDTERYILDPHGAVALLGLEAFQPAAPETLGVFLETAHPAKFLDVVSPTLGVEVPIPKLLQDCLAKQKQATMMPAEFEPFRAFLLNTL